VLPGQGLGLGQQLIEFGKGQAAVGQVAGQRRPQFIGQFQAKGVSLRPILHQ